MKQILCPTSCEIYGILNTELICDAIVDATIFRCMRAFLYESFLVSSPFFLMSVDQVFTVVYDFLLLSFLWL